jgi:hypothetical protein
MSTLIRLVEDATHHFDEPAWLESLDVDAYGGLGHVRITHDRSKAQRFADIGAAFECWKRQSTIHPVRLSDGKPNRPLTAFTITFESEDDEAAP